MTALTARMTPADEGIAKAREGAKALDRDGFPSWENIAKVHRKASEARLDKIKEMQIEINDLRKEKHMFENRWQEALNDLNIMEIEMHNEGMEGH